MALRTSTLAPVLPWRTEQKRLREIKEAVEALSMAAVSG